MAYLANLILDVPLPRYASCHVAAWDQRTDAPLGSTSPLKQDGGRTIEVRRAEVENDQKPAYPFNDIERLAVMLGDRDPLPRPGAHRRLATIAYWLFGVRGPQPLADKRLEALRLLAMSLRRRPRHARHAIGTAMAAGIPLVQIHALLARQAGGRTLGAADG